MGFIKKIAIIVISSAIAAYGITLIIGGRPLYKIEVVETKNIVKAADGAETDGVTVDVNSLVSMNKK